MISHFSGGAMVISVIIPVYNEVQTIGELLKRVRNSLPSHKEIIVVNDGSNDGTEEFLKNVTKTDNSVKVIHHQQRRGKGTALVAGIAEAQGDIIIFQDADLEYDPQDYPVLLDPILSGKTDVVYGSRLTGGHTTMFFWYYLGNRFLTVLFDLLFNVSLSDVETGSKAFKKEVLKGIVLHSASFDIEIEVTAKVLKQGYKIYEAPISYSARKHSEGKKLNWRHGVTALFAILRYRFLE